MTSAANRSVGIADTSLTEEEIAAATDVLRSGMLRQGPKAAAFETAFAERFGARHAIASTNGSMALFIAYADFLEPGDEVIVPSFTFFATASMVVLAGGVPVMVDADPETWLIDLDAVEAAITPRTRAIAPVHLFGNVCDVDRLAALAASHDLRIVHDAAQAHGATWDGREIGGLDDYVCYSFYPTKNMFVGEGGMTTTNSADSASKMRMLRDVGARERYLHEVMGYNLRITDLAAAIGLTQLGRFDAMMARRRRNAERLLDGLGNLPGLTLPKWDPRVGHAWHQFCVLVDGGRFGRDRDGLQAFLAERRIGSAVHYPRGLHQQPVFVERFGPSTLPVTERLSQAILALPVHHGLEDADIDAVVDGVRAAARP